MELPWKVEGGSAEGGDASASGGSMKGGDPALMGGHTEPTTEGAEYAQGAQDRAKAGREAQQRQLAAKTGDTLYPASGMRPSYCCQSLMHPSSALQVPCAVPVQTCLLFPDCAGQSLSSLLD